MAGGALTADARWAGPRRGFLFPVKALSRVFRGKFLAQFADQAHGLAARACRELHPHLYAHHWVVYAKQPLGGPEPVLDYLARYSRRVAISDERITAITAHDVLFRVRPREPGAKRPIVRLPGTEFIARFLTHVLPPGFKRIRHYGPLSPARKRQRLAAARNAHDAPQPDLRVLETVVDFLKRIDLLAALRCPHCGGQFMMLGVIAPVRPERTARRPP